MGIQHNCNKGTAGKEINMENEGMTNNQFKGIIKMIIALIKNDTPKDELIEYLTELIKE